MSLYKCLISTVIIINYYYKDHIFITKHLNLDLIYVPEIYNIYKLHNKYEVPILSKQKFN